LKEIVKKQVTKKLLKKQVTIFSNMHNYFAKILALARKHSNKSFVPIM